MSEYKDLYIDSGADFEQDIALPVGLVYDDLVFNGDIKRSYASSNSYSFSFEPVDNKPNHFKIVLSDSISKTMKTGRYYYDVFVTLSNGDIKKILNGQVTIEPSVTSL